MKKFVMVLSIVLFIVVLQVYAYAAAVPPLLSYSGKITDKNTNLLPDGKYDMRFSLWTTATGGTAATWTELHYLADGNGVTVTAGAFNVLLGSITALPADFSVNYYLQTEANLSSGWETFGRRQIVSVAYACQAEMANGVANGCITSAKIAAGTITGGNIGTGQVSGGNIGSGTITSGNLANKTVTFNQIAQGADLPVGTILAWTNNLAGTPALPAQYMECNGQQITDSASPMNGQYLPNLNGAPGVNSPGVSYSAQMFLRGGTTSGVGQADAFQGHLHSLSNVVGSGTAYPWAGSSPSFNSPTQTGTPISDGVNGTPRTANETRPINMSVIWIMKIK